MIIKLPSSFLIGRHSIPTSIHVPSSTTTQRLLHASRIIPKSATAAAGSSKLSFASPESDFTGNPIVVSSNNSATMEAEWSQQLSLASTAAELALASPPQPQQNQQKMLDEMLHQWQVSSPESALGSVHVGETLSATACTDLKAVLKQHGLPTTQSTALDSPPQQPQQNQQKMLDEMLHQWQVSSPESALGSVHVGETLSATARTDLKAVLKQHGLPTTQSTALDSPSPQQQQNQQKMLDGMLHQWQVLSPESALGSVHVGETLSATARTDLKAVLKQHGLPTTPPQQQRVAEREDLTVLWEQQWLRSAPESATGYVPVAETVATRDLRELTAPTTATTEAVPLPTTWEQALADSQDRAMVITTAHHPFRVVHVNALWEGLCGYTQAEAKHQPIGQLLKGDLLPAQQETTLSHMVHDLKHNPTKPHDVRLINYTKLGRRFQNHLQVGPLFGKKQEVEYFVGILEDVSDVEQQRQQQQQQQMAA